MSHKFVGFARMSPAQRLKAFVEQGYLSPEFCQSLNSAGSLSTELADQFIENCVGCYELPLGVATNFVVDGKEVLVPMAIEESSVVAAASHGAKLARPCGGFFTEPFETISTCQIQILGLSPEQDLRTFFTEDLQQKIAHLADDCHPRLVARGGGVRGVELRSLEKPGYYVVHIHVDTKEAMGANLVNTIAEEVGAFLPELLPCTVRTKILTNLAIHRVVRARCEVDVDSLAREGYTGEEAAQRICAVWEFADLDPFRAATHNKGVMNGVDAVVIATGNDWRAVEAGAHAYASLTGSYKPLTRWLINENGRLEGHIALPLAVGTVGGVTKLHPTAKACLALMDHPNTARLSGIIAATGLAQNLSAIRALACEGIQKGHMALHEKNLQMMRQYDNLPPLELVTPHDAPKNS